MSLDATRWAWTRKGLRPIHKLILLALADRAGADDRAYPSYEQLIEDTGADRKTVWAGLKALTEATLIVDTQQRCGGTGQVVIWQLVGVEHRVGNSSENGTIKGGRNSSKNGTGKRSENGTIKGFRKRNYSENGTVPKTDRNSSENGTGNSSENGTGNLPGEPTRNHTPHHAGELGEKIPPSGAPQNAGETDEILGEKIPPYETLPPHVPKAEWDAFAAECAERGRPLSVGQRLAYWQELAGAERDGYDPARMLARATMGGFRTLDRNRETMKAPAVNQGAGGVATATRGKNHAAGNHDNSAVGRVRAAVAARQASRAASAGGGFDQGGGGDSAGVIDLGEGDFRRAD